jgi:23S rRNA (cytidine1920-2'-O)/16S rRNA (cytidine1409-2'-O)-methyltransferase
MSAKLSRKRLDALIVERGLADSPSKAQAMILAGEVLVDGIRADKPGAQVANSVRIEVQPRAEKYVSRGGIKLEGALADFGIDPRGRICVDIGASTGGFTDCLLQHGAARVYAVDVNVKQLDWKLRQNPSVVPIERNARELSATDIPESASLITVDVSFISVTKVLPPGIRVAAAAADFLILIKPQFELPREDVPAGGIIAQPALHQKAISYVQDAARAHSLEIIAIHPSRITGAEGNQEFFLHGRKGSA